MEKEVTCTELAYKREISKRTRRYIVILGQLDDLFDETHSLVGELYQEECVDKYFSGCSDCYLELMKQVQKLMFDNMALNLGMSKNEI